MNGKRVYEIDGDQFSTLEEFYDEISRVHIPDAGWGHNLDALNDIRGVDSGHLKAALYSAGKTHRARGKVLDILKPLDSLNADFRGVIPPIGSMSRASSLTPGTVSDLRSSTGWSRSSAVMAKVGVRRKGETQSVGQEKNRTGLSSLR